MSDKELQDQAITYLQSQMLLYGVAACRVKDGEAFLFSKDLISKLNAALEESGKDQIMILIHKSVGLPRPD